MKIVEQRATLMIINPKCPNPTFPCYNHVIMNGKTYTLKGSVNYPETKTLDPYFKIEILLSGILKKEKGHMPNPMHPMDTVEITEVKFL